MSIQVDPEFRSLIPPLQPEELTLLQASLESEGCRDPLVVWGGILLDGHNRYDICERDGIAYETEEIELPDRESAKIWILKNQLGRRNLIVFQRAELALKLEPLIAAEAKKRQQEGGKNKVPQKSAEASETRDEVAKLAGVSHDTISKVKVIIEQADEALTQDLRADKYSVNAAYREVCRRAKRARVQTGKAEAVAGQYRVIYADPPWQYGDSGLTEYGHAKSHYPTMSLSELCAMPVKDWAEADAVLFLWVTSPMLDVAFEVIKAWGFKYKTSMVWDKVKHNFGHYCSVRHEFLLICTRGSCTPDSSKLFDSVQTVERTEKHSEKPEEFRKIIETLYTHGAKLELFSRAKHKGWKTHGNQIA